MKTLVKFLRSPGFVVLTGKQERRKQPEYEAWAYEGPLDFEVAAPVRFGLDNTPIDALKALDWQLEKMAKASPAPLAAPLPPVTPRSARTKRQTDARVAFDDRELATILAALRYHQDENLRAHPAIPDKFILDIATNGGVLEPLTCDEVDELCAKLNDADTPHSGLHIDPPPRDRSREPLHRVVYTIDVPAKTPRQAARRTHQILSNRESWPPILQVIDRQGRMTTIDLASCSSGSGKPP